MSRIQSLCTVSPPYRYSTDEIIRAALTHWLQGRDERSQALALKIMRGADIRERYSVVPLETVFSDASFERRNDLYIEAAKSMAEDALRKACEQGDIPPQSLDFIITTSCTGFMIPSVDAYLIDKLGLRQDIIRMPITEMGCAGGTAALTYANQLLKDNPKSRAAVIAVEAPSVTFQRDDFSMENLVSTAIFADGAACTILGGENGTGPNIIDTKMYHFPNSTHLMGYKLTNSGLKIILDREVPDAISSHFERFFFPLLERNQLELKDIEHFVFHPGGKKIIQSIERILEPWGKHVNSSKAVLQERGNLSSATVLFVLDSIFKHANPKTGDLGYMLAFGPGFSAHSLLLRW